jgi:crotonobetainyl-CoA:carnitine CoA-transferase CaiB-like acyl-CoA transferase
MLRLPQFRAREVATADPWLNPATGYPILFTRHPAARTSPPPEIGEHQDAEFLPR